jgi:putative membrane protein
VILQEERLLSVPFQEHTFLNVYNESEDSPMMWGYGFGWGWLMMSLGTILWIAVLVVLVWALIRWLTTRTSTPVPPPSSGAQSGPTALEILRQRYARGEIDTATFEQMRERLAATPGYRPDNQPMTSGR